MGKIQVPGGLSGRMYDVTIEGDTPTDAEVARASALINQREQDFAAEYEQQFGRPLAVDDGTALGRGFDVGKTSAYSALGTAARDIGEATGFDWLENLGSGMEGSARAEQLREAVELPAPTRWEDVTGLGSGLTFLGEVAGQSAPEMGATLGATAAGTVLGGPGAGLAAGMATAAPFFYGRNIERQETQIESGELAEKDRLNAFLAAGGQSALNVIGDKLLLTGKLFGLNIPLSKNLFVRSGQLASTGAATEVPTEITQQILERAQAGMPLDDDEAIKEYIEVGVAAGLLGGAIGGATGPLRRPTARDDTPAQEVPETQTPEAPALADVAPSAQQDLPTLAPDEEQGTLFPDAAEQRAPDPILLTPEQRVRPGEQLELPIRQPRVLQPQERVDAQREMELYRPEGAQADLFSPAPPVGRPALEVMDELQIAPRAPIRKRMAAALDTDNQFLEQLKKYSRTPGVKKETRTAIDTYLARQTPKTEASVAQQAPELKTGPEPEAEVRDVVQPTPTPRPTPKRPREDVSGPEQSMGDSGVGARGRADTGGARSLDVGPVGVRGPAAPDAADTARVQPTPVTPTGMPDIRMPKKAPKKRKALDTNAATVVRQWLISDDPFTGAPATLADLKEADAVKLARENYRRATAAYDQKYGIGPTEIGLPHRRTPSNRWNGVDAMDARKEAGASDDPEMAQAVKKIERASIELSEAEEMSSRAANDARSALNELLPEYADEINADVYDFVKRAVDTEVDLIEPKFTPASRQPQAPAAPRPAPKPAMEGPTPEGEAARLAWEDKQYQAYIEAGLPTGAEGDAWMADYEAKNPFIPPSVQSEPTQAMERNAMPGAETGAAGQVIPEGIRPEQGRTLESQAPTQREPIARQLTAKAKLEAEAADIKSLLASRRKLTAEAKTQGTKRSALEGKLRKRLNGVNTQLYNVTSYLRSEAGRQQAIDEGTSNAVNMMTAAENDTLRSQLRDWHTLNAPEEVQAYDAEVRGDTTGAARVAEQAARRDPTTVPDKRALLELLSRTKQQLRSDAEARAAYTYFSKTRDVADALDNLAFDSGSPDVPKRRIGAPKLGAPLEAYWQGTGKDAANKAASWVEKNLSEDSVSYMDEQIAGYISYNAETVAAVMDQEAMTRIERDKAETEYLKTYYDAEAALRGTEAFEGTTPEAMTREELRALDQEAMGTDIDFAEIGIDLGNALMRNKRRSIAFGLEAPMHPAIVKALRTGNMRAALQGIAATNVDPYIQNLAAKLVDYVGDTKVYTTAASPRVRELLTSQRDGNVYPGTYVLMDKTDYDRVAGETSEAYADSLQNSILLDEATGFNAHTILHEMVHAATSREIRANPNGPFAKRMQALLDASANAVGAEFDARGEPRPYGFDNINEFVAEAMSNHEFQQVLSRIFPNTKRASALTQFVRDLFNFVRAKILNRPVKTYEGPGDTSVFDEVDYLTQSIFSLAPEYAAEVSLFGDAMSPLKAREKFDVMAARAKEFKDTDAEQWKSALGNTSVARGTRSALANLFMPVRNLTEFAKKYFPEADDVYQSITTQRELEEYLNKLVSGSLEKTSAFLDANPQLEGLFHSFRTRASRYEIDVRKPRSFYDKFVLSYYTLGTDGTPLTRQFESFDSFEARKGRIDQINAAEKAGARITKARKVNDPDQGTLTVYDNLRKDYETLARNGGQAFKDEYNRMLGLPEALQREAAAAVKDQIDAMLPGVENAESRNIILRGIYNKIFSEKGLVAYQSLLRSGDVKVTYTGINPDTNTTETFSHGFKTYGQAQRAAELLGQLPPEYNINDVSVSRRGPADKFNKKPVPPTFVSDVTSLVSKAMDARADQAAKDVLAQGGTESDALAAREAALQDGQTLAEGINEQVVEMALNALPETSIFQSYRARKGVSGFKGDLSPLQAAMEELNPEGVDTLDDPRETRILTQDKMQSLARQVAGIRQRASSARVSTALDTRLKSLVDTLPESEYQQALVYYEALTTAVNNPAVRRSNLIAGVNTGAFVATLWGNVSSVVMNLMSIPTIVYPRLAVTYGPVKAAKIIHQSFGVLVSSGRTRLEPVITADGEVGAESVDAGYFGVSLTNRTFGDVDTGAAYNKGQNRDNVLKYLVDEGTRRHMFVDSVLYDYLEMNKTGLNKTASKVLHAGAAPMHHSERYMRETTMIATYMLELDKLAAKSGTDVLTEAQMREAAVTAAYETERMTGTIPAAGAPNWALKGIMPAVFMFKRYPLAIVNMIVGDAKRAFPNKRALAEKFGEGSPEFENAMENRKLARLQLAGILGSIGLWSGAAGMPMYGAIADLFDALFTDDDEEGFDTLTRRAIGELGYKGLGNYLFGVEMSSRIGLSGIFYREPLRADDQPPIWNLIEGAGGPAISLAHGWTTRSRDLWNQGETYRAMESAMPASMRNVLRSYRFVTTGGADSLRDDIISDIGPGQALAQVLGFAPSTYIRQLELNSAAKTIDSGINSRRTRLLRRLNIAKRQRDRDEIRDIMQDIQQFNRDHPYNGISDDTISRSAKTFDRTSERVVHGIVYTDKNRPAIKDIVDLMDSNSTFWN